MATQGKLFHVARHLAAQVFVDIQLGEVLTQHESVSAQAGEQAHLRVDDVARLGVAAGPAGQEAYFLQAWQPFGEDLADNLKELLAVVLDVLARLVGVGVGASAADNLARMLELLTVDRADGV